MHTTYTLLKYLWNYLKKEIQ